MLWKIQWYTSLSLHNLLFSLLMICCSFYSNRNWDQTKMCMTAFHLLVINSKMCWMWIVNLNVVCLNQLKKGFSISSRCTESVIFMLLGLACLTSSGVFCVFYVAWKRKTELLLYSLLLPYWPLWNPSSATKQNCLLSKASAASASKCSADGLAFLETSSARTLCFLFLTSYWSLPANTLTSVNKRTVECMSF